jgi:hypothetical protein
LFDFKIFNNEIILKIKNKKDKKIDPFFNENPQQKSYSNSGKLKQKIN